MAGKKSLGLLEAIMKHLKLKELNTFDITLDKVKIISSGMGKCTAELTLESQHSNAGGAMHGGFSATLVDMVSSYAMLTHPKGVPIGASIDIHMKYLKAARLGDEILVEANTIKIGKNLAFLDVVIKNKQTEQILVTGTHTKFIGE